MDTCPLCRHGSLRIMAAITQEAVITRMLRHLKRAAVPPPIALARARQVTFDWVASAHAIARGLVGDMRATEVCLVRERHLWAFAIRFEISPPLSQPPFPRPSPRGTPVSRALPPPAARVQAARCRSTPCAAAPRRGGRTARRAQQAPWARHGRWRRALGGRQRTRPFGIPIRCALRSNAEPSLHRL